MADYGQIRGYVAPKKKHSANRIMNNHWKANKHLGGGNSNIFYFHPENWGRFQFLLISFKWVESTN